MKNPKVSIVIPVYNGSNYLKEAIDSALVQTYKNIEIIVVNDGSNDNGATAKIARSYGNRIRYYKKTNGGVATALNLGIQKMTGEYFSWLSHDDLYTPDKIANEVKTIQKYPPKTLIYCNFEILDQFGNHLETHKINPPRQSELLLALIKGRFLHGCTLLIPKVAFDEVGLFDRKLQHIQDFELWFRMIKAGYIFKFIPDILVKSRRHNQQTSLTGSQRRIFEENCFYTNTLKTFSGQELFGSNQKLCLKYLNLATFFKISGVEKAADMARELSQKHLNFYDCVSWYLGNIFYSLSPKQYFAFCIFCSRITCGLKRRYQKMIQKKR